MATRTLTLKSPCYGCDGLTGKISCLSVNCKYKEIDFKSKFLNSGYYIGKKDIDILPKGWFDDPINWEDIPLKSNEQFSMDRFVTKEVEINNSPLMKSDFLNKMEEKISTLFKHIMLNRKYYENIYCNYYVNQLENINMRNLPFNYPINKSELIEIIYDFIIDDKRFVTDLTKSDFTNHINNFIIDILGNVDVVDFCKPSFVAMRDYLIEELPLDELIEFLEGNNAYPKEVYLSSSEDVCPFVYEDGKYIQTPHTVALCVERMPLHISIDIPISAFNDNDLNDKLIIQTYTEDLMGQAYGYDTGGVESTMTLKEFADKVVSNFEAAVQYSKYNITTKKKKRIMNSECV